MHEDNEWGIELGGDEGGAGGFDAAGSSSGAGAGADGNVLPEGIEFSMPASGGIDQATLEQEGVGHTDASVDELADMLSALNRQ